MKRQKNRIECTVSFTKEATDTAQAKALQQMGSDIAMKGFRPGKVPPDMLREKVEANALFEETIRVLLPAAFRELITKHDLKPIIPPHVEAMGRDPLQIKIVFIEKPEVTFKGIDKLKLEKKDHKVEDKDVQQMVDFLLEKHQKTSTVDRAAKENDRVTMDFEGKNEKGEDIPEIRSNDYQIVLGSKTLIPGFEDALVGLKAGDRKSVTLTFPEKTPAEHLKGKPVTFSITVKRVEEVTKPELTDEFAKTELHAESAQGFRDGVRSMMIRQEEQVFAQRREQEAMDAIRKVTVVDLAPELVAQEARSLAHELEHQLQDRGMQMHEWLKQQNKTPEQLEKDLEKQAGERLTLRLGVQQLIIDRKIEASDAELATEVEKMLAPLSPQDRLSVAGNYQPGKDAYEQLKWQKSVEKLLAQFTAA
jgi:trigger factor